MLALLLAIVNLIYLVVILLACRQTILMIIIVEYMEKMYKIILLYNINSKLIKKEIFY